MADDFHIERDARSGKLQLRGTLDLYHAGEATQALRKAVGGAATLDLSGLERLDTVGALLLRQFQENSRGITIEGLRPEHAALFDMVAKANIALPEPPPRKVLWRRELETFGKRAETAWQATLEIISFFGQACASIAKSARSPRHLRLADIMHHIEETGIDAVPIITLMAFGIAIVVAYQGVAQLRPMGAERLTVNLVAVSVLREMGVLLTAIMVAGRSGSAFTAQIGVMKVGEEIDALRVIGIDPFEVLVAPRLLALLITLPVLTFLADLMGLLGGGVMSTILLGLPLPQYMEIVRHVAQGHDFLAGMIKAPVFAFLIAMVGCMHGMKVSGSAESVGRETTASVVKSIFLVMMADALFSILFDKVGI